MALNPGCKLVLCGAKMRGRGKQEVRGVHVCVYALRMTSRPSRVIAARRFCVERRVSNGAEFGVSDDVKLKRGELGGGGSGAGRWGRKRDTKRDTK